jgi:hypothetical protein
VPRRDSPARLLVEGVGLASWSLSDDSDSGLRLGASSLGANSPSVNSAATFPFLGDTSNEAKYIGGKMTKSVLLLGAVVLVVLLAFWLFFDVIPAIGPTGNPKTDEAVSTLRVLAALFSMGRTGGVFSGLAPVVKFWIFLLVVALIRDYAVSIRDRKAVAPFASVLTQAFPEEPVTQSPSDFDVLSTNTSGSFAGRSVNVTLQDYPGSRSGDIFRVDVSCACPWALDIRRRSTFSRLLGLAGAIVVSGNPELDSAVVVQADDETSVRRWLNKPAVRQNILSLFQQHNLASVSLCTADSGRVLRGELPTNNPLLPPPRDSGGITSGLCALAESAESMR